MLTYRNIDYDKDLEQIIPLLQKNLDPGFTENFFRWKHLENPFGKSYGLLALHGENIVGLRMFMYWKFIVNTRVLNAIRPVDTVTDKAYRGKGVFKKLTLNGLENNKGNYDIIFNTPNSKSLPGYLKMGWERLQESGSYKIGVVNFFKKGINLENVFIGEINGRQFLSRFTSTLPSNDFLKWRYKDPSYKAALGENSYIIYKKSWIKAIPTLIIYEFRGDYSRSRNILNALGKKEGAILIYYYLPGDNDTDPFIFTFSGKNPIIVLNEDNHNLGTHLQFSLGDLEAKL